MVRTTLQQRSEAIARKRAEGYRLPSPATLTNAGLRRTDNKRWLLQAVVDLAAEQSRTLPFKARF